MVHLKGAKSSAFQEGVGSDAVTDRAFLKSVFDCCIPSQQAGSLQLFLNQYGFSGLGHCLFYPSQASSAALGKFNKGICLCDSGFKFLQTHHFPCDSGCQSLFEVPEFSNLGRWVVPHMRCHLIP